MKKGTNFIALIAYCNRPCWRAPIRLLRNFHVDFQNSTEQNTLTGQSISTVRPAIWNKIKVTVIKIWIFNLLTEACFDKKCWKFFSKKSGLIRSVSFHKTWTVTPILWLSLNTVWQYCMSDLKGVKVKPCTRNRKTCRAKYIDSTFENKKLWNKCLAFTHRKCQKSLFFVAIVELRSYFLFKRVLKKAVGYNLSIIKNDLVFFGRDEVRTTPIEKISRLICVSANTGMVTFIDEI